MAGSGLAARDTGSYSDHGREVVGIGVVIASYRRPEALAKCLEGLQSQTRRAAEVVVVVRTSDEKTADCVARLARDWPQLRCVRIDQPGTVAAYNCGLAEVSEELVAYIDDDAVPTPDWLERITGTFAQDEGIAGVGGRDKVIRDGQVESVKRRFSRVRGAPTVGRLRWFGRTIAFHHVGTGRARDVDILKGVNMAFRRGAVITHGFDERLRGDGSQVHSELSICLPLRRRGLRIVYDPSIVVMHYPAPRAAGDHRHVFNAAVLAAAAHNEALQILDHFGPVRRLVFAIYGMLIGNTDAPGLAVLARDLINRKPAALHRFAAAQRGRASACRTHRRFPREHLRRP